MTSVTLGDGTVSVADVVAVARHNAQVSIAPSVMPRLQRARAVVERFAAGDRAVYGLNTGLGAAVDTALAPEDIAQFQRRAVMARAVGVGGFLETDEVRATLFVRLAGIAHGASGLAPDFAEAIRAMLHHRVHPRARRTGTLGEADLAPLAQLFLPLAGERRSRARRRGAARRRSDAPRRHRVPGLRPKGRHRAAQRQCVQRRPRVLVPPRCRAGAGSAHRRGRALARGVPRQPLAARPARDRAAPGAGTDRGFAPAADTARGKRSFGPENARRVQDPLSFRCLAPVLGAAFDQLARADAAINADLNGAGDSPAVLADDMLSTVNFDTTALALAFEGLGLALAHAAATTVFRILKLMSPAFSDLPRFLTRHGGSRTGFATVQKTASALEAEIRHLALPLGAMTAPVADGAEDYAPMTPRVIEKTREIVRRLTLPGGGRAGCLRPGGGPA